VIFQLISGDTEVELAGLIVRTLPCNLGHVQIALNTVPGLETHHTDPTGRLIVTLELESQSALADSINQLQNLNKILSVSLVYQHSEEIDELTESQIDPFKKQTTDTSQWGSIGEHTD
jgi:nitrate reductase NapD